MAFPKLTGIYLSKSTTAAPQQSVKSVQIYTPELTSFWCLYCKLRTDFLHCFGVSIVDTEQVNAGWVNHNRIKNKFFKEFRPSNEYLRPTTYISKICQNKNLSKGIPIYVKTIEITVILKI